ncbi:MAG: HipA N-terminal domain-containing protein [Candidatus Omnitrophica bacterium]|nr:HipA N-terminal domain-containing protein [Candidatus Omnitrophota bacterium]MCB9748037.1 HipA N-terminal domain-containing protein [Candidatus Omnitrophota bacterium]
MNKEKIYRSAKVYYKDEFAGVLKEAEKGYIFQYDKDFMKKNISISVTLPVQEEPFESEKLFPFFRGLLPEGWYLNIVSTTQHVDTKDWFGVLLATTSVDTIGAVTVRKDTHNKNNG